MQIHELHNSQTRARLFAALANPTRLEIVFLLSNGEDLTTTQLATRCGMSLALACHHVKVLTELAIVRRKKAGLSTRYVLQVETLEKAFSSTLPGAVARRELRPLSPALRILSAYPVA